ncbi:MAG: hypothetical protein E7230_05135 [Clostridiales bacterium]|nr:hypothetical protein [Clostridiales bacterium]MBR0468219.1 hypothetical protein [Mogibacterium sp.]
MRNNKKGGAKLYLVILLLIVLAVAGMFIKLNWRRFKAEASFAFTVTVTVVLVVLIIILLIRHSIRKARREKAKELARLEKERLEAERIAAGGKPSTLGDGKFEMSDIGEAAGVAKEKIEDLLKKDE